MAFLGIYLAVITANTAFRKASWGIKKSYLIIRN